MSKKNDNLEFAKILAQLIPSVMRNQPTLEPVQSMSDEMIAQKLYNEDPVYKQAIAANHPIMTYQRGRDWEADLTKNRMLKEAGQDYTYGGSQDLYPNKNVGYRYFAEDNGYGMFGLDANDMLARARFSNKRGS
jgi:hypothetical protein